MAVSLVKGANVSLSRTSPNLKRILLGLGWSARASNGAQFDLDASIFMLRASGKVDSDDGFIFYGQLKSTCGSVEHTGDNRDGVGDGDDEAIEVNFDRVPPGIVRLVVTVTIHEAELRKQNFGQVSDAFIRVVNLDNDQEIARFDLSEDFSTETALVFGEVYRHSGEWKFKAVGQGSAGGLEALCRQYGVNVG